MDIRVMMREFMERGTEEKKNGFINHAEGPCVENPRRNKLGRGMTAPILLDKSGNRIIPLLDEVSILIDKYPEVMIPSSPKYKNIEISTIKSRTDTNKDYSNLSKLFGIPEEFIIPSNGLFEKLEYENKKKDEELSGFIKKLEDMAVRACELPPEYMRVGKMSNSYISSSILPTKFPGFMRVKPINVYGENKPKFNSQYMKDRCDRTRRMIMGSEIPDVDFGLRVERILQNNRNPNGRQPLLKHVNNMRDFHKYYINAGMTKSEVMKYGKRKEN